MEISLPTTGCNVFTSRDTISNYSSGVVTDYTIYEGRLFKSSIGTYTTPPETSLCIPSTEVVFYNPVNTGIYYLLIGSTLTLVAYLICKILFGKVLK